MQIYKASDRNSRRAGCKLQQARLQLGIPRADAPPEVLYHLIGFRVAPVVGILHPILNIDVYGAPHQELEFALVQDLDEIRGDEFVETGHEGGELLFDALLQAPFGEEAVSRISR